MTEIENTRLSRGPCANRLSGKVALITGAGSGQGQIVALLFAEAGAIVYASDINGAGMLETKSMAEQRGLSINIATVDASSHEQVSDWVASAAAATGHIDVLYNNGANVYMAPFAEMTIEQWRETLRLELDVIFMPTKAVWPIMTAQRGGSIINIASGAGMLASQGLGAAAHAAGKGGVIAVTRQLALEGAPHWIRVNSIAPGATMTKTLKGLYDSNANFRRLFDATPSLERHGFPIDIAYAGLFLASDEASYITGVNLAVDGGATSKVGLRFVEGSEAQ